MIKKEAVQSKNPTIPNVKLTSYRFNFMDNDKSEFTFSIPAKNKLEAKILLLEKIENELCKKVITKRLKNTPINDVDEVAFFLETTSGHDFLNALDNKYEEAGFIFQTNTNIISPLWIDEFIDEPWYKNN